MARRSPTQVSQKYETGCSWRMFGIFNSREDNSNKNRRHLNAHTTGNGNLRSRNSEVLSTIDEKYPADIAVSSRRRTGYSCKSMSFLESDLVADWRNESRKMTVDQRLFNKKSQGKEGASSEPDNFLDALQILYSKKELFLKLLQDPNSLLVKQIHYLESSQVKEPYQARQKRMTRLRKSRNSNVRQSVKPFKSFDGCDLSSSCEPHSSNKHSYAYTNVQNIQSSHFPFGRIKRRLRHVMRARRKEQQGWKTAEVPSEFHCNFQVLKGGKKVKECEIGGSNSPINVHASIAKRMNTPIDLKKRDKAIMLKDSELCMRQEAATFDESCSQNTSYTSVSPCDKNTLNIYVESRKGPSQMLNCGIEEYKHCTNSEHCGIEELVTVNTLGDKLKHFDEDISIRKSLPGDNLNTHYDIPRDGGYKDSPTQNLDMNNTTGRLGPFLDSEIQVVSFSPEVASSSLSSCLRIEDTLNMRNIVEQLTGDDSTNPPMLLFQQDEESPVQVMDHDKFEENHFADLIESSLHTIHNLTFSNDILDHVKEILQAFSWKLVEHTMKRDSSTLLQESSTFDELKGLTSQLSDSTVLHDCVIENFKELYQNCCFPPHLSSRDPNFQAYVVRKVLVKEITELVNLHFSPHPSTLTLQQLVEKDLARCGSWLNIQVDTEDIAIEVEKDVLEKLVLEIASEIDSIGDTLQ